MAKHDNDPGSKRARTDGSASLSRSEFASTSRCVLGVPRSLSARDIPARLPSVAMPTRRGVPAAALQVGEVPDVPGQGVQVRAAGLDRGELGLVAVVEAAGA